MKRKDINETAFDIVQKATGQSPPDERTAYQKAAAEFGKAGGLKGGVARKKALRPAQRLTIAKKAAKARWGKKVAD
jgi:hypothetical protein